MEKQILDIDDVERIARSAVSRRVALEIRTMIIESTDIRELAGILVYETSGFIIVVTSPKKFMSAEKLERKYWSVKLEATTGKVISFRM